MGFSKLPIGVITKSDHPDANLARSIEMIRSVISYGPIVITSSINGAGIEPLKELVKMNDMESMKSYVKNSQDECLLFTDQLYSSRNL